MKIAIIDIIGLPYDDRTVDTQGLGGSESAVIYMSRALAQLGFSVTVYNNCNVDHAQPGIYNGVTYRPLNDLSQPELYDVVVSSRTVIPFVDPANYPQLNDGRALALQHLNIYQNIVVQAKQRVLWMHDTFCLGDNLIEELAVSDRITDIFTLSDFHLTYVANCHHGRRRNFEVLKPRLFITRNGARNYATEIDLKAKDPDLFVYNASVTKGMVPLVNEVWPRVKQQIPQAKLKVIGGYYRFSSSSAPDQQEQDWRRMVADPRYAALDIEFTGVIPQREIANILTQATFTLYPTAFPETYGISTLESLLYNTPAITCRFGALEEIALNQACYLIDYAVEPNVLFPDINKPQQIERFVTQTVRAHQDRYLLQQKQYYCNSIKHLASWDSVALQWKQHFYRQQKHYLSRQEFQQASKINKQIHKIWGRRYTNPVEFEHYKSNNERPIAVVSTFYNASAYIAKCIHSLATQDYDNYRVYLVDDASTDDTVRVIQQTLSELPDNIANKFSLKVNSQNLGAVRNQVTVFRQIPDPETIVMIVDGDDSLINDNNIFNYYNTVYSDGTEFTYGSCWSQADNIPLISQPYPDAVKKARAYRQHHFNWILPYTHLRTFKQRLIDKVSDSMFKDSSGAWFRAGGDGSVFYSLIEAADPDRVRCLTDIVYNYNDINPINDYKVNSTEQNITARQIVAMRPQTSKFSVIIPTMWRCPELFERSLNNVVAHDLVDEVIIIDNDHAAAHNWPVLQNAKVRILVQETNIKVNPAWNLGVATSTNEFICLANDDIYFDNKLFDRIVPELRKPDAGVFGIISGEAKFGHPELTDGSIDFIEWSPGKIIHGFGQLMLLRRENWVPIIPELEIYFGDDSIFHSQLVKHHKNYMIANIHYQSPFAATSSDQSIVAGHYDRERVHFANWFHSTPVPALPEPTPAVRKHPKRILIAIPTARNIEAETFKSIYDLIIPDGYEVTFQYFYGYQVDQVRNLIADWVTRGFDYLFSVDSDIAFAPDTLMKLLAHDKDLVSGLYIQRKPGEHILEVYRPNEHGGVTNIPYADIRGRGLVEIAGCGFGCVLVKAEVIKAIGYPQFKYHSAIDHRHTISEDVYFCRRARESGYRLYADTSILCKHIGSTAFVVE